MVKAAMATGNKETNPNKKQNKGNYIADLLQCNLERVYINIHLPPAYKGKGVWASETGFKLENAERWNSIMTLFGGIKLNTFDLDNRSCEEKAEFYLSDACPEFGMQVEFRDGSFVLIYVTGRLKESLNANLTVQYNNYTDSENRVHKCFTASISDKGKEAVVELANNMFDEFVKTAVNKR